MPRIRRGSATATAAAIVGVGSASALVIAVTDAITFRSRLVDEIASARPLWLHTFSVAMMTTGVAVARLVAGRPFARPGRIACLVLAAMNLTVPVLERDRPGLGPVLSITHLALALLLLELAVLDGPASTPADGPTATISRTASTRSRTHAHHH